MSPQDKNSPGSGGRQGVTGHSPALTWLFLAGLRPRRARLRFTRQVHYTAELTELAVPDKSVALGLDSAAVMGVPFIFLGE